MSCLRLPSAAALTALLALSGCRDPEIKTYAAPKDVAPTLPGLAMGPANTSGVNTAAPTIRWQLPAGWQDQGANNIRLGNILVTGPNDQRAEMTVTRFEGDVGGDLANINRWRNQLQLPPIDDAALPAAISHRDFPAGHMDIAELVSDAPLAGAQEKTRTLVAWLPQENATWFFKLTGSDPLVAAQRDAFNAFLNSVEFSAPSDLPTLPAGHPPLTADDNAVSDSPAQPNPSPTSARAGVSSSSANPPPPSSMAGTTLPADAVSNSAALVWTAPAGWSETPPGPVRKGSFAVRDSSGNEADLSITAFPGDVGGLLANLNRWRGELQLAPLGDSDVAANVTTIAPVATGLQFTVVDFAGTSGGAPTRTLGAILRFGDDTWFFKLKGPAATVANAKPAFLGFLETVKTR